MLTPTTLKKLLPNNPNLGKWLRPLNDTMRRYEINTPERAAAFLSQVFAESDGLTVLEERLSYSPGRIAAVWPKRFANAELARPYSRNPEKLANAVYANRLGNGDEASRDGYRFRGRGLIQVTGRVNYEKVGKALDDIDLINMPDTLLEPKFAALSAGAFWSHFQLNECTDFGEIVHTVTGSREDVPRRKAYYDAILEVLDDGPAADVDGGVAPAASVTDGPSIPPVSKVAQESWFE